MDVFVERYGNNIMEEVWEGGWVVLSFGIFLCGEERDFKLIKREENGAKLKVDVTKFSDEKQRERG